MTVAAQPTLEPGRVYLCLAKTPFAEKLNGLHKADRTAKPGPRRREDLLQLVYRNVSRS